MSSDLHIGIYQIDSHWLSPNINIAKLKSVLDSTEVMPQLIVLPEMWTTGFIMQPQGKVHDMEDESMQAIKSMANAYNVDILGSYAIKQGHSFYNRAILYARDGQAEIYDKQYLFTPSGEGEVYTAGAECKIIDYHGWKLKLQICYDLRFPESVRTAESVDAIIYLANWPTPRVYHWQQLLIARAIENQCFTIGCNRTGTDGNGWSFPGSSMIVDYTGEKMMELSGSEEMKTIVLNKSEMEVYRKKLPFLKDKKL